MEAALIAVITNTGAPIRAIAKYRPHQVGAGAVLTNLTVACATQAHGLGLPVDSYPDPLAPYLGLTATLG